MSLQQTFKKYDCVCKNCNFMLVIRNDGTKLNCA